MTDEIKNDFSEIALNIEKKLAEKIDEKFSGFESKLDEKLVEKTADPKPQDFRFDSVSDDDDGYVTKKDMKAMMKEFFPKVADVATERAKKEVATDMNAKMNKNSIDSRAYEDFPMLEKGSPQYDPKFEAEVVSEMRATVNQGKSNQDPYLVYDSAARVYAKWSRENRISSKAQVEAGYHKQNANENTFSVTRSNPTNGDKPTEEQIAIAATMGMTKETLTQQFENKRKS